MVPYHRQHWFDVEREAEINIGTKWPTDMTADECVLSDDYQDKGFSVGDKIVLASNVKDLWREVATVYNL